MRPLPASKEVAVPTSTGRTPAVEAGGPLDPWAAGLAAVLVLLALAFATWGLIRLNTWYLASDQFAFLTLAEDLREGTVFHDDWALETLRPFPRPGVAYDALAQTYYWRDKQLYSRYPPGFPAMLALAGTVGGQVGQHLLNPLLYLAMLVILVGLTWTLMRDVSPVAALGAGAAAVWLFLLLPTRVHLWGITVARDLPAHALGLLALLAAARRAPVWSAVALGLACTVRPDAVLYLVSVAAILLTARPDLRSLAVAGVAFAAFASPVLVYNWVVEGSAFRFTQGTEFRDVFGAISAPPADGIVKVVGAALPSGGAFRLANLRTSMPGNAIYLVSAFGWFFALVLGAAGWSLARHRLLAAALVPYALVAFVFYSCWSHPDSRYLAGVAACLIPLAGVGAALLCERVARAGTVARVIVLLLCVVPLAREFAGAPDGIPPPGRAGAAAAVALVLVTLGSWIPARAARPRRLVAFAPAAAFAILGVFLVSQSSGRRDSFQQPQVERARAEVSKWIPPGSLVVTSTALGRPVENLRLYSDVEAFYLEEFGLLGVNADIATASFALEGRRTFYLLDARDRASLRRMGEKADVRLIERRRGPGLLEWYVDPRRVPAGAALYEVSLPPELEVEVRRFHGAVADARSEEGGEEDAAASSR